MGNGKFSSKTYFLREMRENWEKGVVIYIKYYFQKIYKNIECLHEETRM